MNEDVCPICRNFYWIPYMKDGKQYMKECECGFRQKEIARGRYNFANIPEQLKDVKMNTFTLRVYQDGDNKFVAKKACNSIKYWLDNLEQMQERGMGLYIYSTAKGSGKTRMAASIANELIEKYKIQVRFTTSMQILEEIKRSWDRSSQTSESQLLDFLSTTKVLIIDDFGTETIKDWINDRFYQIVNGRYIDKKITIFTSNMSIADVKYDGRITSRIKERCFEIPFPEEDVREHIKQMNDMELRNGSV